MNYFSANVEVVDAKRKITQMFVSNAYATQTVQSNNEVIALCNEEELCNEIKRYVRVIYEDDGQVARGIDSLDFIEHFEQVWFSKTKAKFDDIAFEQFELVLRSLKLDGKVRLLMTAKEYSELGLKNVRSYEMTDEAFNYIVQK